MKKFSFKGFEIKVGNGKVVATLERLEVSAQKYIELTVITPFSGAIAYWEFSEIGEVKAVECPEGAEALAFEVYNPFDNRGKGSKMMLELSL